MSAIDDILGQLPIDQLADQLGADPQQVQAASAAVLPALLGGLQANAGDGGASSILSALGQHNNDLLSGGIDLSQIDTQDGAAIAGHIFGDQQDAVANQLGGLGGGAAGAGSGIGLGAGASGSGVSFGLVERAEVSTAPMVTGSGRRSTQSTAPSLPTQTQSQGRTAGPGSLDDLLKDVLGSAVGGGSTTQAPQQQSVPSGGSIITDILGGLLGGGRR